MLKAFSKRQIRKLRKVGLKGWNQKKFYANEVQFLNKLFCLFINNFKLMEVS